MPEKITSDGSVANEAAIRSYNQELGTRITSPMLGCKSCEAAQATLIGIELMHMLKKDRLVQEVRTQGFTPAELFSSLAA